MYRVGQKNWTRFKSNYLYRDVETLVLLLINYEHFDIWNAFLCHLIHDKNGLIFQVAQIFTSLLVMQTRYNDENSICPSHA